MNKQRYPTDLTDRPWDYSKALMPAAKTGVPWGHPLRSLAMRLVIKAIMDVGGGGMQWRMLPKEYPPWKSVYPYFRQWRDDGTWQRMHDPLRAKVRQKAGRHKHPTAGCLDRQSIKTTAIAGVRGYDKAKNVNGRKRHILVDTLGLLLVVVVTAASVQAREGAKLLFQRFTGACKKLRRIWLDGGYRGPSLLEWVADHCRFCLQIVMRTDDQKGFAVLPRRWVVAPNGQPTFAWFNHYRRLRKD